MTTRLHKAALDCFDKIKRRAMERVKFRGEDPDIWEYFVECINSFDFRGESYILDLTEFVINKRKSNPVVIKVTRETMGQLEI